jgi:hypothetical protein
MTIVGATYQMILKHLMLQSYHICDAAYDFSVWPLYRKVVVICLSFFEGITTLCSNYTQFSADSAFCSVSELLKYYMTLASAGLCACQKLTLVSLFKIPKYSVLSIY